MMESIYLDRLSFSSLNFVLDRAKGKKIYYFDESPGIGVLVNFYCFLKVLETRPQALKFILGEIRDERGECQFIRVFKDIKEIVLEISRAEFSNNSLLEDLKPLADPGKLLIFLEKKLAEDLQMIVVLLNAARQDSDENERNIAEVLFLAEETAWDKYLETYAGKNLNIKLLDYKNPFTPVKEFFSSLVIFPYMKLKKLKAGLRKGGWEKSDHLPAGQQVEIGSLFTARPINFDPAKRSDLFWLLKTDLPRDLVMVYFNRQDLPISEAIADKLSRQGLRYCALSEKSRSSRKVPLWSPGKIYSFALDSWMTLLKKSLSKKPLRPGSCSFFMLNLADFGEKQAFWKDFFQANNIKVNIAAYDFSPVTVAMNSALESLGGVSISYQFSDLWFSSLALSCSADVLFSFSPAYRWIWKGNNSQIRDNVSCGYITDYVFKEVKEESLSLRNKIKAKGADFIISFFDENSSDDRMSVIPNSRSAGIYKFFLERLLKDRSLGLIFKPGYPKTLYKRLSGLEELILEAKITGRCVFLDEGSYVTDAYPAQASQAADLCVSLLLSGTTALEAFLSGARTIFLDLEKLYSHPVYSQGKSDIVFNDPEALFRAIQSYRSSGKKPADFGDLSGLTRDKDPFKDGKAALRMGSYIKRLSEAFNQGMNRENALECANADYAGSWGKENIEKWL
jgi:hypothetical protein